MIVERIIAMFNVGRYEHSTKKMGNCLIALAILISVGQSVWGYRNAEFNEPHITCLEVPTNRSSQITVLNILMIFVHFIAVLIITFIYFVHRRHIRSAQSLTTRFQFSENLTSSRLLITLSFMQFALFITYSIARMCLAKKVLINLTESAVYRSNILALYLVSEYTLLLPLITMLFLRRAKQARQSDIRSMIQLAAHTEFAATKEK
ncbi:hypothetical protein DICVIV_04490 [Dictyocaulus viviparus]|uniref:Integral membrane protein, C.elegans Sra family n=1 Tax=Dictyocaulus viviparus TaxID=29172 RepID=A0A0D8XXY1_DICVI|nr:hypothetical protein DICVIV_04490 [Dictyocaulus viviparus]